MRGWVGRTRRGRVERKENPRHCSYYYNEEVPRHGHGRIWKSMSGAAVCSWLAKSGGMRCIRNGLIM